MDSYYNPDDLERFAEIKEGAPELWDKYLAWYSATMKDGKLSHREKSLIALAVAHVLPCSYCIDAYTQECLESGSNVEEMTEAIHVASAIRGGASLAHGVQMRNVAKKLSF
jgi:alkylhydroperoxidase/carboxymuconolactone decarboxylase family protein